MSAFDWLSVLLVVLKATPASNQTRGTFACVFTCCLMCWSRAQTGVGGRRADVWWLVQPAEAKDETCVRVCTLDKKESSAGKLTWVVVQSLWLFCSSCCLIWFDWQSCNFISFRLYRVRDSNIFFQFTWRMEESHYSTRCHCDIFCFGSAQLSTKAVMLTPNGI